MDVEKVLLVIIKSKTNKQEILQNGSNLTIQLRSESYMILSLDRDTVFRKHLKQQSFSLVKNSYLT